MSGGEFEVWYFGLFSMIFTKFLHWLTWETANPRDSLSVYPVWGILMQKSQQNLSLYASLWPHRIYCQTIFYKKSTTAH